MRATVRPAGRHDPTRPATGPSREQLTIAEVCAELKVSRSTFYYWRQTGRPSLPIARGGSWPSARVAGK